jgi:hypothetical protein
VLQLSTETKILMAILILSVRLRLVIILVAIPSLYIILRIVVICVTLIIYFIA